MNLREKKVGVTETVFSVEHDMLPPTPKSQKYQKMENLAIFNTETENR